MDFRAAEFEDLDLSGRTLRGVINFAKAVLRGKLTNFAGSWT